MLRFTNEKVKPERLRPCRSFKLPVYTAPVTFCIPVTVGSMECMYIYIYTLYTLTYIYILSIYVRTKLNHRLFLLLLQMRRLRAKL